MVSAMLLQSNTPKCQPNGILELLLTRNFTIQGCPRSGWMHSFLYYAGCGICWIYSLVLSIFWRPSSLALLLTMGQCGGSPSLWQKLFLLAT